MVNEFKYPDFVESTGYGTGGGLCGWNCRHNFMPFDPETMENNIEKYGMKENEEAYKISQIMRKYERRIRITKRKVLLTKNSLNKTDNTTMKELLTNQLFRFKKLLNKQSLEYRTFCNSHKLKPQRERLQIPPSKE